jgi:hypothetical protein
MATMSSLKEEFHSPSDFTINVITRVARIKRPSDDPYYVDDTLDANPPYYLLRGKPTPEALEAARQLAIKHGYPAPRDPPEPARRVPQA